MLLATSSWIASNDDLEEVECKKKCIHFSALNNSISVVNYTIQLCIQLLFIEFRIYDLFRTKTDFVVESNFLSGNEKNELSSISTCRSF